MKDDNPFTGQFGDRELPVDAHTGTVQSSLSGVVFYFKWTVVFMFLIVSVLVGMLLSKSTNQLPDIRILETYRPNESTQIFDRTGTLIANIHGDEDRVVVSLKQISPHVQRAVMAI
jgi:membrane carboxypeptidase/penicillin-binding protein